ncbi:MAG: aminopeptidase P family protein [Magnetococcales bacterium]|nr:aminopeptidase P family protein [Magnetococcales bacterium]
MDAGRLIYAASESAADLYYATRFFAPDPFLYLEEPGRGVTHMATSALEVDRARRTARCDRVHDWAEIRGRWQVAHPEEQPTLEDLAAFFVVEQGIARLRVPGDFPLLMADRLRAAGLVVIPEAEPFWPERAFKTPEEVEAIEAALEVTARGMEAGIGMIRAARIGDGDGALWLDGEPLTSERVRGEIHACLVRLGAAPHHTIVSGGAQGADPHEVGSGPLFARQPIILDIFPRMEGSGYWGDMTRTVCRGEAPDRVRRAWEAVRAAQEVAFGRVRDGVSGREVHEAVTDSLTQAGFPTGTHPETGRQEGFFHGTGHGLGLEIHESPRIGGKDQTLLAGHVVTVEPGVYYPDMGGVRLEDVVVVEPDGCRNLTRYPKFLEI